MIKMFQQMYGHSGYIRIYTPSMVFFSLRDFYKDISLVSISKKIETP